ncbi:caspase family protein [Acaryochloris marina NIES-2412]|uniref:caspase family protein n=1 Tax=Acaryochloris marina TaxID=155978 RepID=UPI004058359C
MPTVKRRQFMQFGGAALATLGIKVLDLDRWGQRYRMALAKNSHRKRALLIGIGDYPGSRSEDLKLQGLWYQLRGAVNDVLLQKELLIHRFGFKESDIVLLTDQDATRANILMQMEQLVQWVQSPDDVVVFHYSGHGSNVLDSNQVFQDQLNGTIVPIDADLPMGYPQEGGEVNDISAGTIFLLREALGRKTKNVTFLLDSCYSGGGVRGNLTFRSRPGQAESALRGRKIQLQMSSAELDYQQRWLKDLNLSPADWIERRRQAQVDGAALVASSRSQLAADAAITQDFHAGVFTYALTRHLWQQSGDQGMGKVIVATGAKTNQFLKSLDSGRGQTPGLEVSDRTQPMFYTPMLNPAAEAVVTQIKGQSVDLLLTGLDPQILEAFSKGAIFTVVDQQGKPQGTVEVESRNQLSATGTFQPQNNFKLEPGISLQEQLRSIPSDLTLRIGLDPSLGADAAQAKQALESIPRIEVVPLLEQEVHYILGKITADNLQSNRIKPASMEKRPDVGSIGLFTIGLDLLPGTDRQTNNGIETAISSLHTKLKTLLVARLVKLTLNSHSSQLNVTAKLKVTDNPTLNAQSFTVRGGNSSQSAGDQRADSKVANLAQIPIGKSIQISVENQDYRDLHLALLVFSPDGDIDILFPQTDGPDAALVGKKQTLDLPSLAQIQQGAALKFKPPLGIAELLILASTSPIRKALVPIQALAQERRSPQRSESRVEQEMENVIFGLLDDLSTKTRGGNRNRSGERLFDPREMAALSIPFEIVDQGT